MPGSKYSYISSSKNERNTIKYPFQNTQLPCFIPILNIFLAGVLYWVCRSPYFLTSSQSVSLPGSPVEGGVRGNKFFFIALLYFVVSFSLFLFYCTRNFDNSNISEFRNRIKGHQKGSYDQTEKLNYIVGFEHCSINLC